MVSQAAEGLAALHATGIVHRDIKPANLLLTSDSGGGRRVLVADLGVAKALTAEAGVTQSVGTPSYMAPEQADPSVALDARADVHALGAVAYALVTGSPPRAPRWPGDVPEPVSALRAIPAPVDQVVTRALDPDRDRRWPDVRSFARALEAACRGVPPAPAPTIPCARALGRRPAATPSTPVPTAGHGRSRTPVYVALGAVALLVAALIVLVVVRGGPGADDGTAAFEEAGVEYVTALKEGDCETAALDDQDLDDPDDVCDPEKNLHLPLARCIDVEGERRVDMIGENRARVVFVGQGYVEMIRGEDTMFRAGFMVGCM